MTRPTDFKFRYSCLIVQLSSWLWLLHSQSINQQRKCCLLKSKTIKFSCSPCTTHQSIPMVIPLSVCMWYNTKFNTRKPGSKTFYTNPVTFSKCFQSHLPCIGLKKIIVSLPSHIVFERMELGNVCEGNVHFKFHICIGYYNARLSSFNDILSHSSIL